MTNGTRIPTARLVGTLHADRSAETARGISRGVGTVVYAYRFPDGTIKIGYSTRVYERITQLGPLSGLVALKSGDYDDEQAIHAGLKAHRVRGREYYRPAPAVLAVINDMRAAMRLGPLSA
jgi:hypothetical protein